MRVGDGIVMGVGWGVKGRKGEDAKTCFSARRTVYVHYFKDIRESALQSDYVMLFRQGAPVMVVFENDCWHRVSISCFQRLIVVWPT